MADYEKIKNAIVNKKPIPKDVIKNKKPDNSGTDTSFKSESKYNTRVRQAVSDEYIRCSKEIANVNRKFLDITARLATEKETLPYSTYLDLESYKRKLNNQLTELQVELNTWDKAREICLNIADEVN